MISNTYAQTVDAMENHVRKFVENKAFGELPTFWLRKSRKGVLAVLCVRETHRGTTGDGLHYYYGINTEVSLSTGSLCAERSAIGAALAEQPDLPRRDFVCVAVLAVTLGDEKASSSRNPIDPCGACREWLLKIANVNPDFRVLTFTDERLSDVFVKEA